MVGLDAEGKVVYCTVERGQAQGWKCSEAKECGGGGGGGGDARWMK